MTAFVFYIVSLATGEVKGINDTEVVDNFIDNGDYVIIHKDSGTFFLVNVNAYEISEVDNSFTEGADETGEGD